MRRDLEALPQILRLPKQEVRKRVAPFLDTLERYAGRIPKNTDLQELMRQDTSVSGRPPGYAGVAVAV